MYQTIFFAFWGTITTLFCVKYIPASVAVSIPLGIMLTVAVVCFYLFRKKLESYPLFLRIFWITIIISSLALQIALLVKVDRMTINVDRWSAIHYFWDALFQGDFPYAVQTHLQSGNTPSPLPVWQLIMLPFYLSGSVGLLQPTIFIAVTIFIRKTFKTYSDRIAILLIIILSPAYWFEVLTQSDLTSCMIFGAGTLALIHHLCSTSKNNRTTIVIFSLLGILMSTRAVLAIPAAFVIAGGTRGEFKRFIAISFGAIPVFILTLLPFYLWDSELFLAHNPLTQHSNKSIQGVVPTVLIAALFLGYWIKSFSRQMFFAGLLISLVTGISLFSLLGKFPIGEILFHDHFDITYLSMGLVFLAVGSFSKMASQ